MRKEIIISLVVSTVVIAIPTFFAYLLLVWLATGNITQLGESSLYYLASLVSFMVLLAILQRLGIKVLDEITNAIIEWLQSILVGYEKEYLEYLVYRFRDFELSGLTISGVLNLGLEEVYVDLSLSPLQPSYGVSEGTIWSYLDSKTNDEEGKKLVVLGSPGSGKTTLLRHSTLALSGSRNRLFIGNAKKLLPIFLTLREHANAIADAPNLSLIHAIKATLVGRFSDPPEGWIEIQLDKGRCVLMMDGLDEIADPNTRSIVTEWVRKQMAAYPRNHFVIASRPYGYESNPLTGVSILEIQPFTIDQIRSFIHNWYLANEITKSQRDDAGVRMKAKDSAEDLIERLKEKPALTKLAENPLLVAMIATVHSFKVPLPGRRVQLYQDIINAFLRPRKGIVGSNSRLREDQKLVVLRLLAWHMMINEMRIISVKDALKVIQHQLLLVAGTQLDGNEFLSEIEEQSGLLLNIGNDHYSFAHLTFQEFLASTNALFNISELEQVLINNIAKSWWAETIRLYAAQTDATKLIEACMENNNINLAYDCVREALQIDPGIRRKFENFLDRSIESEISERRAVAGKAKLDSRLRWMSRLSKYVSIDTSLVSNIEYQFFLDEMKKRGKHYCPDSWGQEKFPSGTGKDPVIGIRQRDAIRFCKWLTEREIWHARYRIPTLEESNYSEVECENVTTTYWVDDDGTIKLKPRHSPVQFTIAQKTIIEQINDDLAQLQNLQDALKQSLNTPPKITELLHNYPPLGGSGANLKKMPGRPAGGAIIEANLSRADKLKYLLSRFRQYSDEFTLNLTDVIESSSKLLLKNRESQDAAVRWLSAVTELYYRNNIDIETRIELFTELLENVDATGLPTHNSKLFKENIIRVLNLIYERKSINDIGSSNSICQKQIGKFLRWYARICIVSFVFAEKSRYKASQISTVLAQPQLYKASEDMVVDLLFMEERVDKKQHLIEGIRLVKEED
jgi:energy-coupling factor transporter ATP-binding protein EcfA2